MAILHRRQRQRQQQQLAPKAALFNSGMLNWDGRVSFDKLRSVVELSCHVKCNDWPKFEPETIIAALQGKDVMITKDMDVDAELIAQLPDTLKLICEAGTGFDEIDIAAARARGIAVCNVPTYATDAVATLTITLCLALSNSLIQQQHQLLGLCNNSAFADGHLGALPHFEVGGKTLGLVGGLGQIGRRVTEIASALGMRVLVSSRRAARPRGAHPAANLVPLDELLARSDFVSVHCPLSDETRGLINREKLRRMKPSAFLINTARGAVVDLEALLEALQSDRIAGAALDAHHVEPLPVDSPLRALSPRKVILTPHIGWQRAESRQRLVDTVAENIQSNLVRGTACNVVNT